jgi:hypothetical protein
MQKREIFWVVVLLLMIGAYLVFFSHRGGKKEIQIFASLRPVARGRARININYFTLDGDYKLTRLTVTELDTNSPNADKHILWSLVSKAGSTPVRIFQYGQNIPGMEQDPKGARPEALIPGEIYKMEVSAGKLKGASKPFTTTAIPD